MFDYSCNALQHHSMGHRNKVILSTNLTFDRLNTWGKALYCILKWMPFLPWKLLVELWFDVTTVSSFHHFILKFNNFLIWISCYWKISPMILYEKSKIFDVNMIHYNIQCMMYEDADAQIAVWNITCENQCQ